MLSRLRAGARTHGRGHRALRTRRSTSLRWPRTACTRCRRAPSARRRPRARMPLSMPMMSPASVTSRTGVVNRAALDEHAADADRELPEMRVGARVHADGIGDEDAAVDAGDDLVARRRPPRDDRFVGRTAGGAWYPRAQAVARGAATRLARRVGVVQVARAGRPPRSAACAGTASLRRRRARCRGRRDGCRRRSGRSRWSATLSPSRPAKSERPFCTASAVSAAESTPKKAAATNGSSTTVAFIDGQRRAPSRRHARAAASAPQAGPSRSSSARPTAYETPVSTWPSCSAST